MSDTPDILLQIAADRARRVRRDGPAQGLALPEYRRLPVIPFGRSGDTGADPSRLAAPLTTAFPSLSDDGILIAEVKRRSPSKGSIAEIPEPTRLAGRYKEAGFRRVSVLTEEARFGGSLADLIAVKEAHPDLAILRKDFLLTTDDVEVSYRAGADAVLLIATLLDAATFQAMYEKAKQLGLATLVEVHSAGDVDKVRNLAPPLMGVNSRDLRRFVVDPLIPLETRIHIDWPCDVVYESGIASGDDVLFVRGAGFSGFLVGESVAKSPDLAATLLRSWNEYDEAHRRYGAWSRLYSRTRKLPLVKVCGITNRRDAEAVIGAGADMVGFVLADSPRRVDISFVRNCADLPILKAAVVVLAPGQPLPTAIADLLREGALDFIQFHGDEDPEMIRTWPGFKAVNLKNEEDAEKLSDWATPGLLIDAFSAGLRGGTGKALDGALLAAAARKRRPWIAGGLNPENVGGMVAEWRPGLVDVSSGVSLEDGTKRNKDHEKIRRFVAAAKGIPG